VQKKSRDGSRSVQQPQIGCGGRAGGQGSNGLHNRDLRWADGAESVDRQTATKEWLNWMGGWPRRGGESSDGRQTNEAATSNWLDMTVIDDAKDGAATAGSCNGAATAVKKRIMGDLRR
jgi:hypothetical protein